MAAEWGSAPPEWLPEQTAGSARRIRSPRPGSHQPLCDPGQTLKSMSQIELPQGPGDRINEAFVSGRAPLEAPPEGFATQACWDPAEKMRCRVVRFLIGFKKFFFLKIWVVI